MIFRQFFDHSSYTYTYLIASDMGREGVLIDPVKEQTPLYLSMLKELNLRLLMTIDTHTHADHITAAGELQTALQSDIAVGKGSRAECASMHFKDDETINIDGIELKALHTPGHTSDSYSLVMKDRVFTGDTLLIRGTGRTDFQEGDPYQQYDSLFNKLLKLPEELKVYPCHNYKGITVSTIGEEKRWNPRLQVSSAEEYANIMNHLNLALPKMMDVAVPANLQCGLVNKETE